MFVREKIARGDRYLYLVESVREGGRVRQRTIRALGRKDALHASGELDRLIASLARHSERAMVLSDMEAGRLACTRIGGPLLFGRLWERLGLGAVVNELVEGRGFEFALERAVFVSVLHRLFVSGSDRSCEKWMGDYAIPGIDGLAAASSLSGDVLAGRGGRACRGGRSRAALREGCDRGGAVRAAARPVHRDVAGLHGHHDAVVPRRGRGDAGGARALEGPPPGPSADGCGGGSRRRGPSGMHRDAARQHRRHDGSAADRGPPAVALRDRPGVRGGGPGDDLGGDDQGTGGAGPGTSSARASVARRRSARWCCGTASRSCLS